MKRNKSGFKKLCKITVDPNGDTLENPVEMEYHLKLEKQNTILSNSSLISLYGVFYLGFGECISTTNKDDGKVYKLSGNGHFYKQLR